MPQQKPDIRAGDIAVALALLTRLPLRADFSRGAAAAWAYPLAGVVLAMLAGVMCWLLMALGLPPTLAAAAWLFATIVLSGAMHEDGLADCADGFWGGWEKARRLEIMKDSRIGTYGVLALGLSLLCRWAALTVILTVPGWGLALIGVAALSRAAMPALMTALPHARSDGLSRAQGRPSRQQALVAVAIGCGAAILGAGWGGIALIVVALLATGCCALIARSKIGGQTGDVLGATQQVCEIALLATLATLT
ncbi:adenosylcobinamide-GDP ribazoletransferase [Shimia biformata]|uniref:adenosylcobinamide-GDP ribazoletransferase n=1 Tax=Shimia biformata TaxID=1294299 RepID=UPI00194F4386|nr:adenosylcobinamide-GDP ribazoletransferase [Shimia biformata]